MLAYPIIAVNDALTKHLFDNRYGTGQSTIDGIIRATNVLLAGLNVVVAGYGWCGRGVAMRAQGMGAERHRHRDRSDQGDRSRHGRLPRHVHGRSRAIGDIFVTVTGNKNVIARDHFDKLKTGAILCNSGHFNVEIDLEALGDRRQQPQEARLSSKNSR